MGDDIPVVESCTMGRDLIRQMSREQGQYGFLRRPQFLKVLPPLTISTGGTKLLVLESLRTSKAKCKT